MGEVISNPGQVGMGEASQYLGLPLELGSSLVARLQVLLDGHADAEAGILSEVDPAHPALAEDADDAIAVRQDRPLG